MSAHAVAKAGAMLGSEDARAVARAIIAAFIAHVTADDAVPVRFVGIVGPPVGDCLGLGGALLLDTPWPLEATEGAAGAPVALFDVSLCAPDATGGVVDDVPGAPRVWWAPAASPRLSRVQTTRGGHCATQSARCFGRSRRASSRSALACSPASDSCTRGSGAGCAARGSWCLSAFRFATSVRRSRARAWIVLVFLCLRGESLHDGGDAQEHPLTLRV